MLDHRLRRWPNIEPALDDGPTLTQHWLFWRHILTSKVAPRAGRVKNVQKTREHQI